MYTQMNSKVGFWPYQLGGKFLVFTRALALQQGSLPPDAKICAASLPKFQLLNSFGYTLCYVYMLLTHYLVPQVTLRLSSLERDLPVSLRPTVYISKEWMLRF